MMATLGNLVGMSTPKAAADPATASAYVGVGSDTIQDLFDAYSGANPYPASSATQYYTPLHGSAASGNKTVSSWDAVPAGGSASAPGCIVAKFGGGSFDRPNGSGNGITALSHSIDGTAWFNPVTTASCTGSGAPAGNVSGQIDFARSSRGPKAGTSPCTATSTANCLDFIPFARDAVSFAYFDHATNELATLTSTQLQQLYSNTTTGSITLANGNTVKACLSQSGSGTTGFWETALGVSDATAEAASAASGCTADPSLLEENGANTFYTFASGLPAGTDAVVDFSVGSWISQANGAALDRSATARTNGVDLGAIDSLGKPYTGTAPNEAPNSTFYASTTYGRNLNVVVQQSRMGTFGDAGLKSLFLGSTTAAVCSSAAQTTAAKFGFSSALVGATCGTPVTANLYS
jgi:hypothetical protein